jgi:flotillin
MTQMLIIIAAILVGVLGVIPLIVSSFLRNVDAGTIRMVSWLQGSTVIYRGPGKSKEVPLLTTGTTLSSKAINVDLDITDQTADLDRNGTPQPIKVRILASAIVSVGDTDTMIKTAANRFFSKDAADQENILIDLLSSSARRAINLLTHDQLFSAKTAPQLSSGAGGRPELTTGSSSRTELQRAVDESMSMTRGAAAALQAVEDDDDPLAVIIRKACSRELTDLGLTFNSLNIKVVQSEVAESRRRQSAAEAQANADIVTAQQARRAKDAQLEAERVISDKQRELEQTKAANAALIAEAEAKKQTALGVQRVAELEATQIAQAKADAEKLRIEAEARARAEAIRITTVAQAQAESIQKVNEAIKAGGESYFRYRQIEMIPDIAPVIADALGKARLVTISGDGGAGGAAESATSNITSVIQTVLAAQLVSNSGMLQQTDARESLRDNGRDREAAPTIEREVPPVKAPPTRGVMPEALQNSGKRGP